MQQDNIEYFSGEVQEILASPPSWVATWGAGILVGTVVLIFIAGFMFDYPEIVSGNVTITTETPPVTVISQKADYIAELKAKDSSDVAAGDLLVVFPSSANFEEVLQLEKDMETIGQLDLEKLRNYRPNRNLKIGELTSAYSSFITALELVPLNESGEIDLATVAAVENVNAQYQRQLRSFESSLPTVKSELTALKKELKNASDQYAKTIDTTQTLIIYKINSNIKNKEAEVKRIESKIEEIKGEISKSNVRKLQAQTQTEEGAGEAIFQLNQKLDELKKAIKSWKEKHLIIAPSEGILQFYSNLKPGDYINNADTLFSIMPKTASKKFVGKVSLPVAKSSKVVKGQDVNIKFERYDFREHGTVRAKVTRVYSVARDKAFYADIVIENGLVTSLGGTLDFYQQMGGKAEIVTENRSFISKLFEKFLATW